MVGRPMKPVSVTAAAAGAASVTAAATGAASIAAGIPPGHS